MVRKVLKFMQELRDSLNGGRIALTNSYQSDKKQDESLLTLYNNKIQILFEVVIPRLMDYI